MPVYEVFIVSTDFLNILHATIQISLHILTLPLNQYAINIDTPGKWHIFRKAKEITKNILFYAFHMIHLFYPIGSFLFLQIQKHQIVTRTIQIHRKLICFFVNLLYRKLTFKHFFQKISSRILLVLLHFILEFLNIVFLFLFCFNFFPNLREYLLETASGNRF